MKISVRDNLKNAHGSRQTYLSTQVEDVLSRFGSSVHQVDVTLNLEGHDDTAVTHCHLTACLGSLGVIAAEWRDANDHHAFRGAMARLTRRIARRVGKRQSRRRHSDPMDVSLATG